MSALMFGRRATERQPSQRFFSAWSIVTVVALGALLMFLLYPMFRLLASSFTDRSGVFIGVDAALEPYRTILTQPYYYRTFFNSLRVSLWATFFAVILGTSAAYFTSRYNVRGKLAVRTAVVLTFVSPPFIGAYAWVLVAGRSGVLTSALERVGIQNFSIYGYRGVILVFSLQFFPFVFLMVSSGLRTLDRSLEEAALNLGSTPRQVFWRVILPGIIPSVSTGALLAFIASFTDVGTPLIIGERFRVLSSQVYTQFAGEFGGNPTLASALASVMLFVTITALLIQRSVARRRAFGGQVLSPLPVIVLKGWRRVAYTAAVWMMVGLAMIPTVTVIVASFLRTDTGGLRLVRGFSTDSYVEVFRTTEALRNSIVFSTVATAICIFAGTLIAYVIVRRPSRMTRVLDTLTVVPYAIAGVVLGIALTVTFNTSRIVLTGTATIIIIAFFIRRVPFSVRSTVSMLQQSGVETEEASINLGVPPGRTFLRITAPLIAPGILSGALLTWATVTRELNATILLYGPGTTTLPVQVFLEVLQGKFGRAAALGTVLMGLTLVPVLILFRVLGKDEEILL